MAIENLIQNLLREKEIARELFSLKSRLDTASDSEKKMLEKTIISLSSQLKIICSSFPSLIGAISPYRSLENFPANEKRAVKSLVKIDYDKGGKEATIEKKHKEKFLGELSLSWGFLKRLKKEKAGGKTIEFKKANWYAKISNHLFKSLSNSLEEKGYFGWLNINLRKANMPYILTSYVSMGLFSAMLAFIFGIAMFIFLLNFSQNTAGILRNLLIALASPMIVFLIFYIYPYTERKDIENKISQEIPFVTIHMSAISGSRIEPTQIFKIIALSDEYPYTKKEIKKILNEVNFYGYDLVTALKNTARGTSSKKLSELLNGMASSITEGTELSEFLKKRAESLLFEHKLEGEKHTKYGETFMDIYISTMIAAPMILIMLMIMMNVSDIGFGIGLNVLSLLIVLTISFINIIFLAFLHLQQPSY